jgi:hypothetical protein
MGEKGTVDSRSFSGLHPSRNLRHLLVLSENGGMLELSGQTRPFEEPRSGPHSPQAGTNHA